MYQYFLRQWLFLQWQPRSCTPMRSTTSATAAAADDDDEDDDDDEEEEEENDDDEATIAAVLVVNLERNALLFFSTMAMTAADRSLSWVTVL